MKNSDWILTARCPSKLGTVDALTNTLYQHQLYITDLHSFDDRDSEQFFIRAAFNSAQPFDEQQFRDAFAARAEEFGMDWQLHAPGQKTRTLLMVSKFDHCLNDLLYRYRTGQLNIEVTAIVSNHPDLKELADWHNIPYYHLPITAETKPQQEAEVYKIIEETQSELVVLARYMQVLSTDMCEKLAGWAINIHHSLLPGFKGAKPYHQAYNKGVKLVGATAHYVNNDLDEGPIITQGVEVVDHCHYPEDLVAKGRDIECITLARAVRYHTEHRVFINGGRTVVFADS